MGVNTLIRQGSPVTLPGQAEIDIDVGDIVIIQTSGGGGYGPR